MRNIGQCEVESVIVNALKSRTNYSSTPGSAVTSPIYTGGKQISFQWTDSYGVKRQAVVSVMVTEV